MYVCVCVCVCHRCLMESRVEAASSSPLALLLGIHIFPQRKAGRQEQPFSLEGRELLTIFKFSIFLSLSLSLCQSVYFPFCCFLFLVT